MASHNKVVRRNPSKALPRPPVTNMAGGTAYVDSPQSALYKQVATSLWSGDGYYEKQQEWYARFVQNVEDVMNIDPAFAFKLAEYARSKSGLALRTSPIALYVEAARHPKAKHTGLIRTYAPRVLLRADEPAEAIAYYKRHYTGAVPHGILRGIGDTLRGFNEYQLAKYKGDRKAVKSRDVFRLARPHPTTPEQEALWGRVVKNELAVPYTWEVELSRAGSNPADKANAWNDLLKSGKLPIFALLRNLRNITEIGADIELAVSQITRERVVGSGILPFQWYKAYLATQDGSGRSTLRKTFVSERLQEAVQWSLEGSPKLPGWTLVACDNSGSMSAGGVTRGMSNLDLGNLFGAMSMYICEDADAGTFGSSFAIAKGISENEDIFRNKRVIDQCGERTGHSTDAWLVFKGITDAKRRYDRVILISDMQCYDSAALSRGARMYSYEAQSLAKSLRDYKAQVNPDVTLYSINVASQDNTTQFDTADKVVELAGWSDSILRFIAETENAGATVNLLEQAVISDEIVDEVIEEEGEDA